MKTRAFPRGPAALSAAVLAAVLGLSCSDSTGPKYDPLVIGTESMPDAVLGEPYAGGINAEGGDGSYSWELVAGGLPRGLALTVEDLTDDDALIQGTPEGAGTSFFTVQVRSGDGQTATQELSIRVILDPIQNVALPPALEGFPYDVALRAASSVTDTARWQITAGTLPAGLTLTDGRITGTPTGTDTAQITVRLEAGSIVTSKDFEIRVVAHDPTDYDITVFEVSAVPPEIQPHLQDAIAEWEAILESDFEAGVIPAGQFASSVCGGFGAEVNGTSLDDMLLLVNIESIDGVGQVLGQAGPCLFQEDTLIPAAGILTLDLDDLEPLVGNRTLTYIIAHEIGHVLGFGSLWKALELVEGAGTADPRFIGAGAVAEWQALGGEGGVPLEDGGGDGTAEVHWEEDVFRHERMTGYSAPLGIVQPMSAVSVASMGDIGYTVDLSAADPFILPQALRAHGESDTQSWGTLGYDVLYDGPVARLGGRGPARTFNLR